MTHGFELVERLHDEASAAGVVGFVDQFDNMATQAMYRLPYMKTAAHVRRGDQVLDWGCGNGHFSFFLESLGARVTGYSFEPPPRCMRGSATFRFVPGSPAEPRLLPFADATFDVVVGCGVLEHVWETGGDERASLAELVRVTKPGGTLLTFHLPNRTGMVERVVRAFRLNKHFHQRKYGDTEIHALWDQAGFDVLETGLYGALPRAELRRLPGIVRRSASFARLYDFVDDTLATVAPGACTNFFVVARSRAEAPERVARPA